LADASADKGAVVVKFENAFTAGKAVVRSWHLDVFTSVAETETVESGIEVLY